MPSPPPTTLAPGTQRPALPVVEGTTTSVLPPNTGSARLSGFVIGPGGAAVPGAIVRIERAIGDEMQALDIASGADGRYDLPGIGGGRYRVRAFLPPTFAQREAAVFFLRDGEATTVDLDVESFDVPNVSIAVAPVPPLFDQELSLAVQVTGRFVDGDGFVRVQPLFGGFVDVIATGAFARVTPPGRLITDGDGAVVLTYTCRSLGATTIQVAAQATLASVPTFATFDAPDCIDPASLTTTTTVGDEPSTTTLFVDGSTTSTPSTAPPPTTG